MDAQLFAKKLIGQAASGVIVPYINVFEAGLAPPNRPAGVFLLLGPTGTGKTKTVEALAEVIHGSERNFLRIDCGEYQMEHEVAKLIGAPPGYLGHRETTPVLNQQKLNAVTSDNSNLSLVLFDEIEKAAPSLTRLLLGVLDKAVLRLGDNTSVNFESSLIFMTSNLGARQIQGLLAPCFGFQAQACPDPRTPRKLQNIGLDAARKHFSPEFINRIDEIITYQPLTQESLAAILEQLIRNFQRHLNKRLGARSFTLQITVEARQFLLLKGTSPESGARELNRALERHLAHPLAAMMAAKQVKPNACVRVEAAKDQNCLLFQAAEGDGLEAGGKEAAVAVASRTG